MKISIAAQIYDPPINGQAVFTVHLAEGLVRIGHEVLVFMPSPRGHPYRTTRNGVIVQAIRAVSLFPLYDDVYVTPFPARAIGRLLDEFQPQLVHLQDHYPLCRGALRAARRRGLPLVGTNHFLPGNMTAHIPIVSRHPALAENILWKQALEVLDCLDAVTAPTETAVSILREQGLRVECRAISCGVELDRFYPDPSVDREKLCRRYGLDTTCKLVLYVGRVEKEKRIELLLAALARLRRDDVQLAIAGSGHHAHFLHKLAARLGLGRRVVFTGHIPDEDLPAFLNSVDIFAMPSDVEMQSIATLEAMATARPVLAADARALPELVAHGVNGYLFRPGDAADAARHLAELADYPKRWIAMGAHSREKALQHDVRRTVSLYEELYQKVLATAQGRSSRLSRQTGRKREEYHA